MSSQPPTTPEQAAARNAADMLARTQDKILPETWELNRWMLASLLAINSAAAAAVYGAQGISSGAKIAACKFFLGGVVSALASGFSLSLILMRLDAVTTAAQGYWAEVAAGGERSAEREEGYSADAGRAHSTTAIPQVLLYVSLFLFLIGMWHIQFSR